MNEQIKAELEVSAKEATLSEAKRINGLRAVFGEVKHDTFYCFFYGMNFYINEVHFVDCFNAGLS